MENAAKALEIAAGVLLAVLIMSLIAYFFSTARLWPEEEDSMETAEQLAKFNLEYEVYDKKAMYGADVISCLTKAISNNEKYVDGGKYLTGNKYGEKFWINVYVNINSNLEESLEIYYFDENTSGFNKQKMLLESETRPGLDAITMGEIGFVFNTKKIGTEDVIYSTFKEDTPLGTKFVEIPGGSNIGPLKTLVIKNGTVPSNIEDPIPAYYKNHLYNDSDLKEATALQSLVSMAGTNMKQNITNQGSQEELKVWSTAVWTSALYDFKTRKFKCDGIDYSEVTGRVTKIYFSEI